MENEVDLANKLYIAKKKISKAFYTQDEHMFAKAVSEWNELTEGMTNKKISRLLDRATASLTIEEV